MRSTQCWHGLFLWWSIAFNGRIERPEHLSPLKVLHPFKYSPRHNSFMSGLQLNCKLKKKKRERKKKWWVPFLSFWSIPTFLSEYNESIDQAFPFPWQGEGADEAETWAGYVNWRGRPALRAKHGGMLAASFVLGKVLQGRNPWEEQELTLFF